MGNRGAVPWEFSLLINTESYHALIGTGQMVDFAETERLDYAKALEIAQAKCDTALIKRQSKWRTALLRKGCNMEKRSLPELSQRLYGEQSQNSQPGYNTFRDIASSEYGLLDKINFSAGSSNI